MQQADFSAAGCLIVPPRISQSQPPHGDSRAGAAHGLRARHEPLLSDRGDEARNPSHGRDRQGRGDRRAGRDRAARLIGDSTRIGVASSIGPGCSIGKRVVLGEGCVLHANVTIYDNVDIGRGVILHSGCVIGADGFGYVFENDR